MRKLSVILLEVVWYMCRPTAWWVILWVGPPRISWPIIHQSIILNSKSLLFRYPTGIILQNLIGQVNFCLGLRTALAYKWWWFQFGCVYMCGRFPEENTIQKLVCHGANTDQWIWLSSFNDPKLDLKYQSYSVCEVYLLNVEFSEKKIRWGMYDCGISK